MKNSIERYGRTNDEKALLEEMPIVGQRILNESFQDFFVQHKSVMPQVTYVIEGTIDFLIDGQVHTVNKGDIIINRPDEVFGALNDTLPPSKTIFFKMNSAHPVDGLNENFRILFSQFLSMIRIPCATPGKEFHGLLTKIIAEHRKRDSMSQLKCRLYFQELLILIYEAYNKSLPGQVVNTLTAMDFSKLDEYILKNIHRKIYTQELAETVGLSESYFRLIFFQSFGYSPNDFMVNKRISVAKQLLMDSRKSIIEISADLGFSSSQYFANTFKKMTGFRPKDYRKAVRKIGINEELAGDDESSRYMDGFFVS